MLCQKPARVHVVPEHHDFTRGKGFQVRKERSGGGAVYHAPVRVWDNHADVFGPKFRNGGRDGLRRAGGPVRFKMACEDCAALAFSGERAAEFRGFTRGHVGEETVAARVAAADATVSERGPR